VLVKAQGENWAIVSSSSPKARRKPSSLRSSRLLSFGLLVSETACSASGITFVENDARHRVR
jgi:hypothetical protein